MFRVFTRLFGADKAPSAKQRALPVAAAKPTGSPKVGMTMAKPATIEPTEPGARVAWRVGSYPMKAVGESHYQTALLSICRGYRRDSQEVECDAEIRREPSNPFDTNAVAVWIDGRQVGYLSADDAVRVAAQMDAEGVVLSACGAKIKGGWRTNQYDAGHFGVRLAIPMRGWIDFGIGAKPPAPATRVTSSPRPEPAPDGPLSGHWVVVMGAPSTGDLAVELAAAGARIMAGVGKSTTLLIVAEEKPFPPGTMASATYRKAEALGILIMSASEARAMMI